MAALTNASQQALWQLLFNGTAWAGLALNGSAGQLVVSLHNADPTEGGSQNTFETSYPNYSRVAVNRVPGQWNVVGASPVIALNNNPITFPQCGGATDTLTFWGIGLALTGPGTLLMSGSMSQGPAQAFSADALGHLTIPGNVLTINQTVNVYALGPALNLPSGLNEGVQYYVGTVLGNLITLSLGLNNSIPVSTITTGCGILLPTNPLVLVINQTVPSFPANGLVAYLN